MPISKKDYPPNWRKISRSIRDRARWCCEWCGAPDKTRIRRKRAEAHTTIMIAGIEKQVPVFDFIICTSYEDNSVKIVLTVAHLDRNRTNNDPSNLAALCQRCHLNHDRQAQHIPHRKYGRHHDRAHQLKLL